VMRSKPRIGVHSETIFPTTCPHLEFASECANRITQPAPVNTRKIVREWASSTFWIGRINRFGIFRLSAEPTSYMNLVATTVTTKPVQSAMALPKNDPQWVFWSEWLYSTIQPRSTSPDIIVKE